MTTMYGLFVDCSTGEQVRRRLTPEERANVEAVQAEAKALAAAAEAKQAEASDTAAARDLELREQVARAETVEELREAMAALLDARSS